MRTHTAPVLAVLILAIASTTSAQGTAAPAPAASATEAATPPAGEVEFGGRVLTPIRAGLPPLDTYWT